MLLGTEYYTLVDSVAGVVVFVCFLLVFTTLSGTVGVKKVPIESF